MKTSPRSTLGNTLGTHATDPFWGRPRTSSSDALPDRCEDVVVGAGITGLTTALLLAQAGRTVCVLEALTPGAGATGRTTGKVSLLQGARLSSIAESHSLEVAQRYLEVNRRGQAWLAEFCDTNGVALEQRAAVTTVDRSSDCSRVAREHLVARSLGLPMQWADELPGIPAASATRLPGQFQIDPVMLVDALTAAVRRAGGLVVCGARVRDLDRSGGPKVVLADGRRVRADTVTVTSAAPVIGDMLAFTRLKPVRSYLLALRHPEPPRDMVLSIGGHTRSLRSASGPDGEPVLLVGGEEHLVGRVSDETARLDTLRRWTATHFPEADEIAAWSAQDHGTTAGLPLVGRTDAHRRVRVATGFDKWGLTNAPAAALAIADDILGVKSLGHSRRYLTPHHRPVRRALTNAATGLRLAHDVAGTLRGTRPAPSRTDLACGRGICPHLGGILSWNSAEQTWDCPLHGSRFAESGEVLEGPATRDARVPCRPGQ